MPDTTPPITTMIKTTIPATIAAMLSLRAVLAAALAPSQSPLFQAEFTCVCVCDFISACLIHSCTVEVFSYVVVDKGYGVDTKWTQAVFYMVNDNLRLSVL